MPVTVAVAHHLDSDRAALVDLLWRVRDLEVVGQAATFDEILELVQVRRPAAVVIDLELVPADKIFRSGSEAKDKEPLKTLLGSQVVAITERADEAARQLATRLGVGALLDKKEVRWSLAQTLLRVTGSMRKGAP
jgi:DNA-binding NarL/FixJ family response regulator